MTHSTPVATLATLAPITITSDDRDASYHANRESIRHAFGVVVENFLGINGFTDLVSNDLDPDTARRVFRLLADACDGQPSAGLDPDGNPYTSEFPVWENGPKGWMRVGSTDVPPEQNFSDPLGFLHSGLSNRPDTDDLSWLDDAIASGQAYLDANPVCPQCDTDHSRPGDEADCSRIAFEMLR